MAMASAPAVQRLYDVCMKVFTWTSVPSEAQVSNVRAVLGTSGRPLIPLTVKVEKSHLLSRLCEV